MTGLQRLVLAVLGLLLCAVIGAWWLRTFERVTTELPLPPRGEAAYNDLYLLKRALAEHGVPVESRARLALDRHSLGAHDVVVLAGDTRSLSAPDRARLVEWVNSGGHLLFAVAPPPATLMDFLGGDPGRAVMLAGDDLASDFGLRSYRTADDAGLGWVKLTLGKHVHSWGPGSVRFGIDSARPLAQLRADDGGYLYARIAHGGGVIDAFVDNDFLGNRQLGGPVVGAFAWRLLQPLPQRGQGVVHLIYAPGMPSLAWLVVHHGWMAWLPWLLALSGWLWWRTQRFGPLRPAPELARRSLLEHVRASGEHLLRYRRGHLLYAPLRRAFDARLRRRDPLTASLDHAAAVQALQRRSGLPADAIDEALRAPRPFDMRDLRLRIARLNLLRRRL